MDSIFFIFTVSYIKPGVKDTCTTIDLKYGDKIIKAEDAHLSTLSSLDGYYAKVMNTEDYLDSLAQ